MRIFLAVLISVLSLSSNPNAFAKNSTDTLAEIPVQHSGRVKPFESFAKEAVLIVTGKNKFSEMSPTQFVWQWMAQPEKWAAQPIIPVGYKPLRDEFSLMLVRNRISPEVLLKHAPFTDEVQEISAKKQKKETLTFLDRKKLELYERALLFQEVAGGSIPGWIAHPEDPRAGWLPGHVLLNDEQKFLASFFTETKAEAVKKSYAAVLDAIRGGDEIKIREASEQFSTALHDLFESRGVALNANVLKSEIIYNRLQPFHWAWQLYLLGALFLLAGIFFTGNANVISKIFGTTGIGCFAAAFAVHVYGFYLRCIIAGRPPVTNMYESIIWVSFAVAFFSLILFGVYRALAIPATAAIVAGFALILAQSFPAFLDPSITPLVPVLRSNFWLTIHVLTITLSYGAFALAWGLGHVVVFRFAFSPQRTDSHRMLADFLYRALQIGVILLATGTVLGGVWANYSWGRFWGWDPKETWALIALLGYLVVLHGRFTGKLDTFGVAAASVTAFLGVVMAWYGVNFVLAAGLHSYGFGGGGAPYVIAVALADLAVIGWAILVYKRNKTLEKAL